ncbi:transketolase, alpha subunit [alpha proteobacterium HIMB114]|nr:transketolase, alpha subunit [alpha proteobacterium HIMB114]
MRNKFAKTIFEEIKKNNKIFVVAADISPSGDMAKYQKYAKNFINVGVAEQSMISMCAGLAMSGMKPFAYTIATFAVFRPFEMIRDDICYQNLPVTIIGMGSGTTYANLGGTHTATEDIAVLRSLPNMQILSPCDPEELEECIRYCARKSKFPTYIRIGKTGESTFTKKIKKKWLFGKIRQIKNGNKTCILTHGPIMNLAIEASKKIKKKISIYSCHTLKPFDNVGLKKIFNKYERIVVLEDHSIIGGLSDIVKNKAYDFKYKKKITTFSLKDQFIHEFSSQTNLQNKHGINLKKILDEI